MKKLINKTYIEGIVYEHKLTLKVAGPNAKNPGVEFISGTISIATNDDITNIIPIHFTYVIEKTKKGGVNQTFTFLKDVIDGKIGCYVTKEKTKIEPAKVRFDSSLGLNDFYNDNDDLISSKRNEGGFVHSLTALSEDEKTRCTFDVDMLITGVRTIEADEERNLPEKAIVKGYVFDDYRKTILPVELSAINPNAIAYFEGLEASAKEPVFTEVRGRQVVTTIKNKKEEENAFGGEPEITYTERDYKDWVITWAKPTPYEWDDENTLTAAAVSEMLAARDTYLAGEKLRRDEYKASLQAKPVASSSVYDF